MLVILIIIVKWVESLNLGVKEGWRMKYVGRVLVLLVLSVFFLSFAFTKHFPKFVQVRVSPEFAKQLQSQLDIASFKNGIADVIVHSQKELDILKKFKIVNKKDIETLRTNQGYMTYEEIVSKLKELASSGKCTLINIGKSWEGRDILGVKFGSGPVSFVLVGLHHAREWISSEAAIRFAMRLSNDKKAANLLKKYTIYVIPVLNPDGLVYSMTKYTMWRKNRRHLHGDYYGVDLNRNYGYHWGEGGASSWESSSTYRGPAPFSEKETQAFRDFILKVSPKAVVSMHSYSGLVLYPYGFTKNSVPQREIFEHLASGMAKLLGNYTPEPASSLYIASGIELDWLYAKAKAYPFVFELGKWFIPDQTQIKPISDNVYKALIWLLNELESLPWATGDSKKFITQD